MSAALRIGLTGGMGSGKSEAAREFARVGVSVIDTDVIARQLVQPGQPALAEIAACFGESVLDGAGKLDRKRLRALVFADPQQRRRLETILHPRIRDEALAQAGRAATPYCVLVIPMLAESGDDYALDRVLLIDCGEAIQRERIGARDGLDAAQIEAALTAQASRAERRALADDIIVNDSSLSALTVAVQRLHKRYQALAREHLRRHPS